MSETKPFDPTPTRLARARREGDVPRSSELTAALALAGGGAALLTTWVVGARAAAAVLDAALHGRSAASAYAVLGACALTPAVVAGTCSSIGALAFGGVSVRSPRLDVTKLAPAGGLRRIISRRSASYAARALVAAALVAALMLPIVREAFVAGAEGVALSTVADITVRAIQRAVVTAAVAGLALGIADAAYERAAWRRRLRMSFDEMKRDLKESEGDPHLRSRRRTAHRALIRGSLTRLPDATFVIANPTHVAVALEYKPPEVAVPRVLLRAVDAGAQMIKLRARALSIPVIEDVVLARTLLATTDVDDPIPRACYFAVARIVAALIGTAAHER